MRKLKLVISGLFRDGTVTAIVEKTALAATTQTAKAPNDGLRIGGDNEKELDVEPMGSWMDDEDA